METLKRVTTETINADEWTLDGRTGPEWAKAAMTEYDIAGELASRIAELEGLKPGTLAWARRLTEIYTEARDATTAQLTR